MNKLKKSLSVLLTLVMLFTTLCFFVIPEANAVSGTIDGAKDANYSSADNVVICVPETIYMTPSTGTTVTGQYYVENVVGADGKVTLAASAGDTTGRISIYAPGATSFKLNVVKGEGSIGEPNIGSAASATADSYENTVYDITNGYFDFDGLHLYINGTGMSKGGVASIMWEVTLYFGASDTTGKTYYAYSTLYAPYYQPVGAAAEAWSGQGISSAQKAWAGSILWVSGVHGYTASTLSGATAYYPTTSGFLPMLGTIQVKNNTRPTGGWIQSSASAPDPTVTYKEGDGNNHRRVNVVSPVAKLTVDTSRYSNFNQIPNFTVGFIITDSENSDSGKWFVADYTGYTDNVENSTAGGGTKSDYGSSIYDKPTGTKLGSSTNKDCDIKYNGTWNKAIATGTVQLKSAYDAEETGGTVDRSAWNYLFVQMNVTGVDKSALRAKVIAATSLTRSNYVENGTWDILMQDMQTAAYVLGNPTASETDVNTAITRLDASINGCEIGQHPGNTAEWAPDGLQVTINFNGNGATSISKTSETKNVQMNYEVAIPEVTVSKTGYKLKGWSTTRDESGLIDKTSFKISDTKNGVIELTAIWEEMKYSVVLNPNGASGNAVTKEVVMTNNSVTLDNTFARSGYAFLGWAETADATAATYTANQVVKNLSTSDGAVVNLYAVWQKISYTLTYNLVGGTMTAASSLSYDVESSFTLPTPTKVGHTFAGWKVTSAGGNWDANASFQPGAQISGKYGNIALTAQWVPVNYTVTWKNYDGTVLDTDTVAYGNMPYYEGADPVKPEDDTYTYTFIGWTPDVSLVSGDVVYTATFESVYKLYTVTFCKEDGTPYLTYRDLYFGSPVPTPPEAPLKENDAANSYTFDKWVGYTEGMTVSGNMSFTASYKSEARSYTITWLDANGNTLATDVVEYGEMPEYTGVLPTKEGTAEFSYEFDKWAPDVAAVTGEATYTATFKPIKNSYKVTFKYLTAIDALPVTVEKTVLYGTMFNDVVAELSNFNKSLFNETSHQTFTRWNNIAATITGEATFEAVYSAVTPHSLTETNTATCTSDGTRTVSCSCGFIETETVLAYNHTLADGTSAWGYIGTNRPSCSADVYCTYKCSLCNATKGETVPASGHDFTIFPAVPATCETAGNNAYKICNTCNAYFDGAAGLYEANDFDSADAFVIEALGHSYTGSVSTAASCTEDGVMTYTCSNDSTHTYTEKISKTGHSYSAVIPAVEVTCTTDGNHAYKTCSACNLFFAEAEGSYSENGKEDNTSFIIAHVGHQPGDEVYENVDDDATCLDPSTYDVVVYCKACDAQLSRETVVAYLPHNASEIVVSGLPGQLVSAATCTDYAVYHKVCSMCETELSDETFEYVAGGKNPAVHSATETYLVNKQDATCYQNGYSGDEYYYCCDALKAEGSVIPKSNVHTPEATATEVITKAATCYEEGTYDLVVYCSVCKAAGFTTELSRIENAGTKEMLAHTPAAAVEENPVAATCYAKGSYESVVYCSVAQCHYEISRTTVTTEKTAHTPAAAVTENTVPATCYANGSYQSVVYCSVAQCRHEISRTTVTTDKTAHSPSQVKVENETAATCYANGSYDEVIYCMVEACKHEISRNTVTTAKLAHTAAEAVKENEVKATCLAGGSYDEVVYCSVCLAQGIREVLETKHYTTPVADHTPGEPVLENVVDPTETEDGSYDEVVYCTVAGCGHEISRTHKLTRLERIIYFVLKDQVITQKAYNGDVLTPPEVNDYVASDNFVHVFKSWDKEITPVNGNATYYALYTEPCDYSELERLEFTLEKILEGFYTVEEGVLEENWAEINAVLGAIEAIKADKNYRDVSEQVAVDLVVDRLEAIINTVCPDAGSALEIRGSGTYHAGTVLNLQVFKMPADTEVTDVIWMSSDSSVVFVINGILYAAAPGTVTITAVKGNLKAELTIDVTTGGAARVIMFDSLLYGANYVVEGSRIIEDTTNIFWSPSAPIHFRVIATGTLKEYVVYVNDQLVTPDENGTYTIAANTGDAHVRIEGRVTDITDDDPDNAEKVSIWELIRRFFKKIGDFFRNLFN